MSGSNFVRSVAGNISLRSIALMLVTGAALTACGGGEADDSADAGAMATEQRSATAQSASTQAVATWTKIAEEGGNYQVLNNVPVRYGAGNKWVKLRVSGTYACSVATFGSDPAPGVAKTCETRNIAGVGNVKLSWTPSGDSGVTGYRVYYGNQSGTYQQAPGAGVVAGNKTTFSIVGLDASEKFYFAVTSNNASGAESDFSNEASALITD